MTPAEALKALEAAGTAQNRKVYARHGVSGAQFGVSYAELGKLAKAAGADQELAEALWASGNHDARVLATMVADTGALRSATLDTWAKELGDHVLTSAVASLAAKTRFAGTKWKHWTRKRDEWISAAGWNVVASLAPDGGIPAADCATLLETIETTIHAAPNRTRHAMNMALIAIGLASSRLERQAIAAAKRIGKVEVDHGETSCKTPDAITYIRKAAKRRRC